MARDLRVVECLVPFSAIFCENIGAGVSTFCHNSSLMNECVVIHVTLNLFVRTPINTPTQNQSPRKCHKNISARCR